MKVALVHLRHSHIGGTERHLNQIAAHLAERGDEVTIVCRTHEEAPHPAVRFVTLRSQVPGSTWRMWAFARDVERHVAASSYDVVYGLGKTWTHDVIRLGGGCHQTYLDLAHAATREPWERWTGRGFLKQRVALALEARALTAGAYRLGFLRAGTCCTRVKFVRSRGRATHRGAVDMGDAGRSPRVITNSEMVKRDVIRRHAVPADRIDVIYNGVDLQRFHPERHRAAAAELRRTCGFAADDFVVLFLGSGYGRKGLGPLLRAFAPFGARTRGARLLVVGYDSAQSAYERQAAQLGIAERARFLGGRRDAEVCYAAADVYALPTLYDPFANSTLEALATGLPVITTTANGAHEILTHRENGSVLRAGHASETLIEELEFWSTAEAAATTARAVAEQFSQERAVRETGVVLDRVQAELSRR